jgi:circadian clock protein KaiB
VSTEISSTDLKWVFRLYVAGLSANSTRAIGNLYDICRIYVNGQFDVEIVDVLENPLRPFQDSVIATPMLIKLSPPPEIHLLGTLDDRDKVLRSLGIKVH